MVQLSRVFIILLNTISRKLSARSAFLSFHVILELCISSILEKQVIILANAYILFCNLKVSTSG